MKVGTLLALAMAAAAPALGAMPGERNPVITQIASEISPARIEARIRKLASFGTRNSLSDAASETRGIGAARRWIKGELDRCAAESGGRLQVAFDEHLISTGARVPKPTSFVNVVATLAGEQAESRGRIYVVSGHYDSMPSSPIDPESDAPGANDDASGTAVSMELACVMSKHKFDATLVFMAVSGEEQALYGSTGGGKAAEAEGLDHARVITNDLIGNSHPPPGGGGAGEGRGAGLAGPGSLRARRGRDRGRASRGGHDAAVEAQPRARHRRIPHRLARDDGAPVAARPGRGQRDPRVPAGVEGRLC